MALRTRARTRVESRLLRAGSLTSVAGAIAALAAGCATPALPSASTGSSASSGSSAPSVSSTTIAGVSKIPVDSALAKQVPASVKSGGLKIVTNVPYPPYQYYAANHQTVQGVDIDLGDAIADVLGIRIEWTYLPSFAPIVPGIQAGKWQGSISGISDNTTREKVLNFVDYDNAGTTWVVAAGNPDHISTYTDMCGKTAAIQAGSANLAIIDNRQGLCTAKHLAPVKVVTYPDNPSTVLAVESGRVVATMQNKIIAPSVIPKNGSGEPLLDIVNDPTAPNGYPTKLNGKLNHSGIAITKTLPTLGPLVYKAALELSSKGIIAQIYKKYGLAGYALVPPTYNTPPS